MFRSAPPIVATLALAVAACGDAQPSQPEPASRERSQEALYVAPPQVREARFDGGAFVLVGAAPPGARVRLLQPTGEAMFAAADAEGRWTLSVPARGEPRVYGVSAASGSRTVQSQGYLLLAPDGAAALLRAGAGAHRLDRGRSPAIEAFDFDREGGAVVSGVAPPGADVFLRVDGRQRAEARADALGRFEIALPQPVSPGSHRLEVTGDGFSAEANVEVSPPAVLEDSPFSARPAGGGWRADWVTPGGGVQSTVLPG